MENDEAKNNQPSMRQADNEEINVVGFKIIYPKGWSNHFGTSLHDISLCLYERIRYKGDWEILRPSRYYTTAGGINKRVISMVEAETQKLIAEMRGAV